MFSRALPEYLAIGMTLEQFYEGPCWLAAAFRKAYRRKREMDSFNAYLQGAYTYMAIQYNVQYFNPYIKNPKAEPWPEKPLDIFGSSDREQKIDDGEGGKKAKTSGGKAYFDTFMSRHNAFMGSKKVADSRKHE